MSHSLMSAGALGAAVAAAREHGLLHELLEGPASALALADRLRLDPWATGVVLDVLVANGIVQSRPEGLALSPSVRLELLGPAGDRRRDTALWSTAGTFLQTGATAVREHVADRDRVYQDVVPRLGDLFAPAAARLAAILDPLLPRDACILDVGAGSGVWSLAMLERLPGARAIGLDLDNTVSRFSERAASLGLLPRTEVLAGDYHVTTAPPQSVDAIVFANVLHLETPERAAAMVRFHASALRPRGRVIVIDALPDGDDASPFLAGYALHLALRLRGARPHTADALREWLAEAGLPFALHTPLDDHHMMGALVATR
jgi:SAM-dependent methyltransferase